jgi:hypothetical protein
MGFMDKAKKMAEQAQSKLDEVQKGFNEKQQGSTGGGGGAAVEYDAHGRPVGAPASAPTPDPSAPGAAETSAPAKAEGDPLLSDEPGSRQGHDAERGETPPAPPSGPLPGMTSGDPLG